MDMCEVMYFGRSISGKTYGVNAKGAKKHECTERPWVQALNSVNMATQSERVLIKAFVMLAFQWLTH